VAGADLRAGDTISCGCKKNKGKQKDITGQKRGSLIHREQKIRELNQLGYGYSYNHGKY